MICGATSGGSINLDLRFLFMKQHSISGCYMGGRKELNDVVTLIKKGTLKPVVDRTFPLAEAKQAHRHMLERKNFGKIVLEIP